MYVEDAYVLLPIILYNFPCLETFVNPGKYLAKLSSAFPSFHNLPNLSTLLKRSFTFAWLSIDGTAETSFKDLNLDQVEFYLKLLFAFFFKKIDAINLNL